jgi:MFS family permease
MSPGSGRSPAPPDRYKWIALSNTTIGVLMVTISGSITIISLPDIFRGIRLDPLSPGNTSYFLWLLMGFLLVTAVLVVSFGRIGDMYGRVRMYNLGFAVFTVFSVLLSVTWMHGAAAAIWLIVMRVFQGVGGAFLFANSSAILTDAFPANQRGLALGINSVAAVAGSFLGLLIGGILAPIEWRLVFLVSVPFGAFGTVWAYLKLRDSGVRVRSRIDWAGNVTFAVGLIVLLTGIVYGIQPYGGHSMGWTNPWVIGAIAGGVAVLGLFGWIEQRVPDPMFRLHLFSIRAFTAGNFANLLGALGRGGLQFMLIIWLQGIWLPQHGYSFAVTPLWAGIYMLPLTVGFLIAGPASGILSDRYGARPFATDDEHLPERLAGPFDRRLLLCDHARSGCDVAVEPLRGPHRTGCAPGGGAQDRRTAADRKPLRRLPRLQPDPAVGSGGGSGPPRRLSRGLPDGKELLPQPDQSGLQDGAALRVRFRDRMLVGRGVGVVDARWEVRARGAIRSRTRDSRSRPQPPAGSILDPWAASKLTVPISFSGSTGGRRSPVSTGTSGHPSRRCAR